MKNVLKAVVLTATMAVSTNAMAYGDWFLSNDLLTKKEVKEFQITEKTSLGDELNYHYSRMENAYADKDTNTIEDAVNDFKLLHTKHNDARAAYAAATGLKTLAKLTCKSAKNFTTCMNPIDAEVVKYYEIAAFADNKGRAAAKLMSYYYGRYDDAGDAHGRYWAKVAQDNSDNYLKNRPARNFKALEDQPEVKIGWMAKMGF